ncbi:nucleotidyltransferase domain-containing protein [Desulfonatronum parangueonense]
MPVTISDNELETIRNTLSSQFPLTKIILFGSQATGAADEKSDVDLLVITDIQGKRRQMMVQMNRLLDNVQHAVDVLILTPNEYESEKNIPGTIAKHAVDQGRIIYERP